MEFLPEDIDQYSQRFTSEESETLKELNRFTHAKVLSPRMLSGHLQGRLLAMFSQMIHPKYVLELGTYTGYSSLCMAEGLAEGGMVHTIEVNDELEPTIRKFHEKAGFAEKIKLHIGQALEIIPTFDIEFDMVFIDADKLNYINYYHAVFDKVAKGGYIIADNVLWSGKVTMPEEKMDKDTKMMLDYARLIQEDARVENILLPVRDGLLIARKL